MSEAIIKVEGLGKKYIISHETGGQRYTALRDIIAKKAKGLIKRGTELPAKEEFWALKDVNFEIKKGEAVGIIGRNGAGKSTLLKILSRITEPSTGKIEINGRMAALLEVGTGFHPELTGRENIFLNGAILGMSRVEIKKKFDEIVDFSGVEKFLDTPVKRYSSGMYVRLAFAIAAHLEPEILVVDEVLAVGDAEFQKKCLGKMNEVSTKEGRTVLFVSHNMNIIRNICPTSIMLGEGQIVTCGKTADVVEKYFEYNVVNDLAGGKSYYHREGNQFIQINNIFINDAKNSLLSVFEKIRVKVCVDIKESIRSAEFFVLIYNTEGLVVLGNFQKDNNELTPIDREKMEVEISFENSLIPGKYFVSVGIFDQYRQFVDWVEHAEIFEVGQSYEDGRLFEPRLGMTVLKTNWHIIK